MMLRGGGSLHYSSGVASKQSLGAWRVSQEDFYESVFGATRGAALRRLLTGKDDEQPQGIVLAGSFESTPAADVITTIHTLARDGVLALTFPDASKVLHFQKGEAVWSQSTLPDDRLGQVLVRANWLSVAEMEAVRVPPSASITSQSSVIVISPSAFKSTLERKLRPSNR